jgi:hypothetical protein
MKQKETVLGVIQNVYGGTSLWNESEFTIILTNIRVIFFRGSGYAQAVLNEIGDTSSIDDEITLERLSSESFDSYLSSRPPTLAINYDDFYSFEIKNGMMSTRIEFYWKGNKYYFKVPPFQHYLAKRWDLIYRRFRDYTICPDCKNKLWGSSRYCRTCKKSMEIYTSDLQSAYLEETKYDAIKRTKQTGLILIIGGIIMVLLIITTLYPIFGGSTLIIGAICYSMPAFFIIVGVLVYLGKRSGKLLFGILCLLAGGILMIVSVLALFENTENSSEASGAFGFGFLFFLYGFYLLRKLMRPKKVRYS